MQDPELVQLGQRAGDLPRVFDSVFFGNPAGDALLQVSSRHVFHCDVRMIVTHAEIIDIHDIGMIKLGDHLVFLQETIEGAETIRDIRDLSKHLQHHARLIRLADREVHRRMLADRETFDESIAANQRVDPGRHVADEQRVRRGDLLPLTENVADPHDECVVTNVVALEIRACAGIQRLCLAAVTEVDNRRKSRSSGELSERDQRFALALQVTEQDHVIAGPGEFIGKMARSDRVIGGHDGIRPVRRNMVHQQAAEIRLPVDDHDLDAHAGRPRR